MAPAINGGSRRCGVLIAAHGDRGGGNNDDIRQLAKSVAAHLGGMPVEVGFINGEPSIAGAIVALDAQDLIVYPLFLADGYFGRTVLRRLVDDAVRSRQGCAPVILPPLGLDPALRKLIVAKAETAARSHGMDAKCATLILLAHGSSRDSNSAAAAEQIAKSARGLRVFHDVRTAFLDQAPSLLETVSGIVGPIVVVGLFASDGLHGANDVSRLMSELARTDAIYVQNAGSFPELGELVAAAISNAPIGEKRTFESSLL